MLIVSGHIIAFVLLILFCAIIFASIRRAQTKAPWIRKMAALDAIEEVVGRATEIGRPIVFTQGTGSNDSLYTAEGGPQIVAGLSVLSYMSQLIAKYNTKLICGVGHADALLPTMETVRAGYMAAGRPEAFNEDMIRYLSPSQGAYASAVMDIINTEKAAATVVIGPLWAESLMFLFQGADVGAIQIGGSTYTHQLPFIAAVCDYMLIGEEVYAASAYLSKEPSLLGSIIGEDITKILAIALVIIAVVASVIGARGFLNIIRL